MWGVRDMLRAGDENMKIENPVSEMTASEQIKLVGLPAIAFFIDVTDSNIRAPFDTYSGYVSLFGIADTQLAHEDYRNYRARYADMKPESLITAIQELAKDVFGALANQEFLSHFGLEV